MQVDCRQYIICTSRRWLTIITEKISQFIAQTKIDDIPQEALELARLGIADFIGVGFAGLKEKQSRIIIDYVREIGGTPRSTVIGGTLGTSPALAALANGTIGHSLDYDDMAISLIAHPSVSPLKKPAHRRGRKGRRERKAS